MEGDDSVEDELKVSSQRTETNQARRKRQKLGRSIYIDDEADIADNEEEENDNEYRKYSLRAADGDIGSQHAQWMISLSATQKTYSR